MRISDWSSDVCSSDLACIATATLIAGYFLFPETLSGHDIRQNTDEGTRKIMRLSTSFMSSSGSLFIVFFLFEVSSVVAARGERRFCSNVQVIECGLL